NVYGMNQGFLSEREQGEIDARLFADIVDEKMAGGLVFTWQDEWFKRTWNTMDYDDPDRRPFWSNAQTNEQQFGLLSFDPGKGEQSVIQVDGQPDDWEKARIAPLYEKEAAKPAGAGGVTASIQKLYVTSDERYVYMRLDFDTETIDWNTTNSVILLDTLPGQGQSALPFPSDMTTDAGFDFAVQLVGPERSNIVVDSYYDSFYYHYGHQLRMIPPADYASTINNGTYHPLRLTLNKELSIPRPGGERQKVPFEYVETGRLKFGNANPQSPDYDSLADVAVGKNVVELRIPWLMLNVKDPSARTVMGDLWKTGLGGAVRTDGFAISALTFKPGQQARIADAFPRLTGGQLAAQQMKTYTWPVWETPTYHERLKQSYYRMKETFGSIR
ncbi:MAG: hypothetical protein K0Q59_4262, partial [Paenibacillus sp.]|nr:hypothetical protein [Paenibacillus sp.]